MRKLLLVCAALFWCSASRTPAAVLLSDSFNYSNGPLVTTSGGVWLHHSPASNTGEVQVVSSRAFLSQTNLEDVNTLLGGQTVPPTTNIFLYASFTINFASAPSGAGAYFAHFKDPSSSGFRDRIYATTNGAPDGFFRVGVANADNNLPSVVLNSNLSFNTNYKIVTRYVPSNAVSTIWVNPTAETNFSVTAVDVATTLTVTSFALRESLSGGNGMGGLFFDNLVVATTFDEAAFSEGPPLILAPPQNQTVTETSNATFTVTAVGLQPLAYQWTFHGTNLPGATNVTLNLGAVGTNHAGPYSVTVTNVLGSTNSGVAVLTVEPGLYPPLITAQPQSRAIIEGSNVTFSVSATGTLPLAYQWQFNGSSLPGATNSMLALSSVSTNQAGSYSVVITNIAGTTNSQTASLAVTPASALQNPALSYVTYNVKGNGATNWLTNMTQVQAIGRQLMYLNPDIVAFNEIPNQYFYEMTNFITAFLPGYYLATNSWTDFFIRSVIASRFPILFSTNHLRDADLSPFGYTNNATFTRDLFEAQVAVPGFPQLLHVFTTHLKSGQGTDDSLRRSAEAGAISNYLVTIFRATNGAHHPYILSGDLNEDIDNPPPSNPQSIQRLANSSTDLRLTSPVNPFTGTNLTFSIQAAALSRRYDYIMPCGLLFSNISSSQVFRSDLLPEPPPPLLADDDRTASDHLPVVMIFANPYSKAFRLTSIERTNLALTLQWQSVPGQQFILQSSSNLSNWTVFAQNLLATGATFTFSTNLAVGSQFFRVYRVP